MKAALLEFELESSTQNVSAFYAGYEATQLYLTREAVCSALTYTDSLWQDRTQAYLPLTFPFQSTPAEPAGQGAVRTAEVIYKAGDDPEAGLLRYGRQTLLLPGSRFRCAVWGNLPHLSEGQIFLISKKRAPARVTLWIVEDVEPNTTSFGPILPVQISMEDLMRQPAYAPLIGTQRYLIVKLPLTPTIQRFQVAGYIVTLPEV